MLNVNAVTIRVAGRLLMQDASLTVDKGARVGLVGQNGIGKSTLLKAIIGDLGIDAGDITLPPRWSIGMTSQEAPGGPESLIDTVLESDKEIAGLFRQADALERGEGDGDLAEIYERLTALDAFSARARAATILAGLGFDEAAQQRPCQDYSGGWRMRVALAGLLFRQPDLLLLDEPTNHLDLEATIWLEAYLKTYPGAILLVSHDRGLLNRSVNRIAHLSEQSIRLYTGGYDDFERTRAEIMELDAKAKVKHDAAKKHMQAFVDRFRYKASKAKQAQSRIKLLEKMGSVNVMGMERTLPFNFPKPQELASPLLTYDRVAIGYSDDPVLSQINLRFDADDRIALLGANGQGKSTLLKLIAGRLAPMEGEAVKSGKLRVGYFAQHQAEELNLDEAPFDALARLMKGANDTQVRSRLGSFGFSAQKATTKIKSLSGGEKARLLFALMTFDQPHILLLDEPTNHLDVDSRQALVQAINEFEGAVVLVSHDPDLVAASADALWLVKDGAVKAFDGDMDDYRNLLLGLNKGSAAKAAPAAKPQTKKESQEARKANKPLRDAVRAAEKDIDKLSAMISKVKEKLADPELYAQEPKKVEGYTVLIKDLQAQLAAAEGAWLKAEADLEQAKSA